MRLLLLFLISTVLFSCKKKDETPPVVNILNSSDLLTTYQVPFTIDLNIEASDETALKRITAQIKTANGQPISNEATRTFEDETTGILNAGLTINDKYVENGPCYIQVIASDGENSKSSFYNFELQGIPKVLNRIDLLVTSTNSSRIDTGSFDLPFSFAVNLPRTDFVAYNPINEEILALGDPAFGARLYNSAWELVNSSPTPNGSSDELFTCLIPEIRIGKFYAGTTEGNVQGFNSLGSPSTLYTGPENSISTALETAGNKLIAAFKLNGQEQWQLRQYFIGSAAFIDGFTINFEPLQLLTETENTVLVKGIENGQGVWKRFFLSENAMQDISSISINTGPAVLVEDVLLFAEDDQMSFSQSFQGVFPIYNASESTINVWEEVDGVLLFNDGNTLLGASGPLPLLSSQTYSENIDPETKQALLIYNK